MELKEARETAEIVEAVLIRKGNAQLLKEAKDGFLTNMSTAILILNNRITELEGQRNKLVAACKELTIESANHITNEGHDGIELNSANIRLIERITGQAWSEI